jgi:DNA-binding transcriptional LysR family regulator
MKTPVNLRSIDLNLLTVFEAVYEVRSQVKASQRLGMTQPAVSNALSRLRYLIGDQLFISRSNGVTPTLKADDLYTQIHKVLDVVRNEFSEKTSFNPETSFRTYVISVSFSGGIIYGSKLYERLAIEAPNTRLIIRTIDPESEIPQLLHESRLDLAIHYGQFPDTFLDEQVYEEDELVILARKDHPRIQDSPSLDACIRESFVNPYNLLMKAKDEALNDFLEIIKLITVLEVPNPLTGFETVRNTDLLALTNKKLANKVGDLFGLSQYKLPVNVPTLRSYLIWSKNSNKDPGHRWLLNQLKHVRAEIENDF